MSEADLRGADLSRADLSRADLSRAQIDERPYKRCLWLSLFQYREEVPAFVAELLEGRIDGSKYEGVCSCLKGTIAKIKQVPVDQIDHNVKDPSELWLLMVPKGAKPGDDTPGGYAAQKYLDWITEWQQLYAPDQLQRH